MIGYLPQAYSLPSGLSRPAAGPRRGRWPTAADRAERDPPRLSHYVAAQEMLARRGDLAVPISSLATDGRRTRAGALYFDLPGRPGRDVEGLAEAASRGAVAVVSDRPPTGLSGKMTYVQVPDVPAALTLAAQRHFGFPDRSLAVVAVMGARGKTTVTHLLRHSLGRAEPVGLLSSIGYELGPRTVPASSSGPDGLELQALLAQMRDGGCRMAVLEVGADVVRTPWTRALRPDVIVMNGGAGALAGDVARGVWSDFGSAPRRAVVNVDEAEGEAFARQVAAAGAERVITFGENPAALIRAEGVKWSLTQTAFRLIWPGGEADAVIARPGRFNVGNVLAAVAAGWALGREPADVLRGVQAGPSVPGRMEAVAAGQPFTVLIDQARTPEALDHALRGLRAVTPGRLLVVFGCDGNTPRANRPALTRVVEQYADVAIATAVNPRGEGVAPIFADMRAGLTSPAAMTWIADRRCAIAAVLDLARPGDCVFLAGKGHEAFQDLGNTIVPCDDRQTVRELLPRPCLARTA